LRDFWWLSDFGKVAILPVLFIGLISSCVSDGSESERDAEAEAAPVIEGYIEKILEDTVFLDNEDKVVIRGLSTGGKHILIFTRHAEKDTMGLDPGLSAIGNKRAEKLNALLANVSIDRVYTTHYRRTYLTAVPLLQQKKAEIVRYEPGDQILFAEQLKNNQSEVALIVGHSNSIPELLSFLWDGPVDEISEQEYDYLFIASISDHEVIALYKFKYKP
jgi:phosphohistidine phosphatase SixA